MRVKFLGKNKMLRVLKENFKDRDFSGSCLAFILKNNGKYIKVEGRENLDYKFNNKGFDLFLPVCLFEKYKFDCNSEELSVGKLEKIIKT